MSRGIRGYSPLRSPMPLDIQKPIARRSTWAACRFTDQDFNRVLGPERQKPRIHAEPGLNRFRRTSLNLSENDYNMA